MLFDLIAASGTSAKYFTKNGVIYNGLVCDWSANDSYGYTEITSENGRLKWETLNNDSGSVNCGILGAENINLAKYSKIFFTIPEYNGHWYHSDLEGGVSDGCSLKIIITKQTASRPPYNNFTNTFIEETIHPSFKYFEIDVSNINDVCQIWLASYIDSSHSDAHIMYITEFGVKK